MSDMLAPVVHKLGQLGFADDEFRNNKEGNEELGFQYFYKRGDNSNWEVFVSYNPHLSILNICYCDVFEKDSGYTAAYIHIANEADTMIACDLLEAKANYLWGNSTRERNQSKAQAVISKVEKMGFKQHSVENNIYTLVKKYPNHDLIMLIEASVSLSIFIFRSEEKNQKVKNFPLLAVRNVNEVTSVNVVTNYLTNYHKAVR
ncbi:MAG: hypothetical protein H9W81_08300 [Enterococcus sp.]|nr:hypothetical protein [Enterococcus sp.]